MKSTADKLVDDYVKRLDAELGGLPRARRRELVQEISEHIAEARSGLASQNEAEIRTLLDRLGDPTDIGADARERFGVRPRKRGWLEVAALVLLLVGGVVLPVIGWFVGLVLLWVSDAWSGRDKLIGTFVVPGGLAPAFYLLLAGAYEGSCIGEPHPVTGRTNEVCTGGPSDVMQVLAVILVTVLFLAPLATTAYLARRRRYQPSEASA
jgi:hypothetical protein